VDGRNLGRRVAAGGTALALLLGGLLLAEPHRSADDACSMDEAPREVTDLDEGWRQARVLDRLRDLHRRLTDRWGGSVAYPDRPSVVALTSLDDLPPELTEAPDLCVVLVRHTLEELEATQDDVRARMQRVWPPRGAEEARTLPARWQSSVRIPQNAVRVQIDTSEARRFPEAEAALADLIEQDLVVLELGVGFRW